MNATRACMHSTGDPVHAFKGLTECGVFSFVMGRVISPYLARKRSVQLSNQCHASHVCDGFTHLCALVSGNLNNRCLRLLSSYQTQHVHTLLW